MGLPNRRQSNVQVNGATIPRKPNEPVRDPEYRLTTDEKRIWSASVAGAGVAAPVLLTALTMLQPYHSKIVDVAAIDKDWRIALGDSFFQYTQHEREAIVIHECLHVTCNHFSRAKIAGQTDTDITNTAEDLEINQMVASLRRVRLPQGVLYPNCKSAPAGASIIDVPAGHLMESYYRMISNGHGLDDMNREISRQQSQANPDANDNRESNNHDSGSPSDDNDMKQGDGPTRDEQKNNRFNRPKMIGPKNADTSHQHDDGTHHDDQSQGEPMRSEEDGATKDNSNDDSGMRDAEGNGPHAAGPNDEGNGNADFEGNDDGMIGGLCGNRELERVTDEADRAGVSKVRPASQSKATEGVLEETSKRMRMNGTPGVSTMDEKFIVMLDKVVHPPELDWRRLLRTTASDLMSKQAYQKTEYSFKRVNRRGSAFMKDCAFPSMVGYAPVVMMAIDTSGSRTDGEQFQMDMQNASEILKAVGKLSKNSFSAFCVDTDIKRIQPVNRVDDLDFTGGGGTDMSVAFKYATSLPRRKRPDVFVLATDGGFDWDKCVPFWPDSMKVIILITDAWYLQPGKIPDWVYDEAKVIDCSPKSQSDYTMP